MSTSCKIGQSGISNFDGERRGKNRKSDKGGKKKKFKIKKKIKEI